MHILGRLSDEDLLDAYRTLVARYHPIKDHANFLRAAGLVARKYPQTRFVLIGPRVTAEQPFFLQMMAEQQLQGRLFLLGERTDIARLTAALDIDCSASWSESFSNTIGEAMACGVPVITCNTSALPEVVGDAALQIDPHDVHALANAITRLLEDESLREDLRQKGYQRSQQFTWAISAQKMLTVYKKLYNNEEIFF